MSGEALEQLWTSDVDELVAKLGALDHVAAALDAAEAPEAAERTRALAAGLRIALDLFEPERAALAPVWRALAFWLSGDATEARFREAVAAWRAARPEETPT